MPEHTDSKAKCPICKKVAVARYRPFCSQRCADLDLGKWLKGDYAIPSEDIPDDEEIHALDELPHPDRDR